MPIPEEKIGQTAEQHGMPTAALWPVEWEFQGFHGWKPEWGPE